MNVSDLLVPLRTFFKRLPCQLRSFFGGFLERLGLLAFGVSRRSQSMEVEGDAMGLHTVAPVESNYNFQQRSQYDDLDIILARSGHTGWDKYFSNYDSPSLTAQHQIMDVFSMHPGERLTELDPVLNPRSRPSSIETVRDPCTTEDPTRPIELPERQLSRSSILVLPKRDSLQAWVDRNNTLHGPGTRESHQTV